MISRIFIDRPIFAWVIAVIIMLAGTVSIFSLAIERYPDIAPPQVIVRATYPGASAEIMEASVTQVIEQQLTGVEGLSYFDATSDSSGRATVTATFEKGTDPDIAQVQVQNKVQQALARLPAQVQAQGLTVTKANADFLTVFALYDESDSSTSIDVADFLVSNLQDGIARVPGVGDITVFGTQYAMRIWLDPFKLRTFNLQMSDVIAALQAQNTQISAGQVGQQPMPATQMLNANVTSRSRLTSPEQFRNLVLKSDANGSAVFLRDVARVELGSENYRATVALNGHPGAGIGIQLAPGADALKTSELVQQYVKSRSSEFPEGYRYAFPRDSSEFITASVREVFDTLAEAIILVVIVMFVFLQSWRATLIPAIAVPVVLLGTFGVLAAFGFSINVLTLFGLVLAIGLLVDDAIVVVENVERVMREEPELTPREATIKSMQEINIALIAIALVLSAVFLPMAFFGGSTGVIFRQFSITIISSMILSIVVALVLSPALAATLLRRRVDHAESSARPFVRAVSAYGERFEAWFDRLSERYRSAVAKIIRRPGKALIPYGMTVVLLGFLLWSLPTSFLPAEDQGYAMLQYTLPAGATQARTEEAAATITKYYMGEEKEDTSLIFTVVGQNAQGSGQNTGRGFLALKPWDERSGEKHSADAITRRSTTELSRQLRDVEFFAMNPPSVRGLGQSGGFTMQLLNTGGLDRATFRARADELLAKARANQNLNAVRLNSLPDVPTLAIDIDSVKAGALGVSQADVNTTLSTVWGGGYVNDWIDRGRVKRVYVQGDAPFRARPEDLGSWSIRNGSGTMTSLSTFSNSRWSVAPSVLTRFNGNPSFELQGQAAEGESTGTAMDEISKLAADIPGTKIAWSGVSYQERMAGNQSWILYGISLLVVFLFLAALYESWSIPIAVMLVIPLGLAGAALAVMMRGLANDIFFQIGLVTTMGLSAKNAILIVEFAEQAERAGKSAVEAALEAARIRLRPIVMTSLAFIFGVLPLCIATGPGAQSRIEIGTAVIGGMIAATALAIFYIPLFFVLVRKIFGVRHGTHGTERRRGGDMVETEVPA